MKYHWILFISVVLLTACQPEEFKLHYTHENVLYLEKENCPEFLIKKDIYVPAYSDLYYESQSKKTFLTVVLSLRNISFTDTIYFNRVEYYGSDGHILRQYIDKILVLRPMESMEFIVEQAEKVGGTGANFVVSYGATSALKNPPFIESVMIGSVGNYGFSFSSPGIEIIN